MPRIVKRTVKNLLNRWIKRICREEYEAQKFTKFNERPIEFEYVFRKIGELYPKTVLDVGTGQSAVPEMIKYCGCLVTAVDNINDYWPNGAMNRHFHVLDDDITDTRLPNKFDMITCISVLEHIENHNAAVKNMVSLLNPGGHLVLTCPYSEETYVKNTYELPGSTYGQNAPYITQSYSRSEIDLWLDGGDCEIVDQEFYQFFEGDFWTVGEQVIPPKKVSASDKHQHTCLLIRKRPSDT